MFNRGYNGICRTAVLHFVGGTYVCYKENEAYSVRLKKTFIKLYVPFIIWNTVTVLFKLSTSFFLSQYFIEREIYRLSVTNILGGIFFTNANGIFWFVFDLILFKLLSSIIKKIVRSDKIFFSVCILVMIFIVVMGNKSKLLYRYDAIIYYLIGAYIGNRKIWLFNDETDKIKKFKFLFEIIISICILYVLYLNNSNAIDLHIIGFIFAQIALSLLMWDIFDLLLRKSTLKNICKIGGYQSFLIYATHGMLVPCIGKVLFLAFPKNDVLAIPLFGVTVVSALVMIKIAGAAFMRISPKLYNIATGSRI